MAPTAKSAIGAFFLCLSVASDTLVVHRVEQLNWGIMPSRTATEITEPASAGKYCNVTVREAGDIAESFGITLAELLRG